jgi:hypothetical protein
MTLVPMMSLGAHAPIGLGVALGAEYGSLVCFDMLASTFIGCFLL